jgi:hypothetical protein
MSEPDADLHGAYDRVVALLKRTERVALDARRASRRGDYEAAERIMASPEFSELRASVDHLGSLVRLTEAVQQAAGLWSTIPPELREPARAGFVYDILTR